MDLYGTNTFTRLQGPPFTREDSDVGTKGGNSRLEFVNGNRNLGKGKGKGKGRIVTPSRCVPHQFEVGKNVSQCVSNVAMWQTKCFS